MANDPKQGSNTSQGDTLLEVAQLPKSCGTPCWQRRGGCGCRCHAKTVVSGRFMFLTTSGISRLFETCNFANCNSRLYRLSVRVSLTRLGIGCALNAALAVQTGLPGFGLRPSLEAVRVVPYTSIGFRILKEIECERCFTESDKQLDLETWKHRLNMERNIRVLELKRLFKTGQISRRDVDPAGKGWLEVSMGPRAFEPSI